MQISKAEFIGLAKKSGNFDDTAIEFQEKVLKKSGIGNETYLPKGVFRSGYKTSLKDGREEVSMVMFGAIKDLLAATKLKPKDIRILVVNCGILNTTPSLSSMIINHFKLRHDIHSFNLGGMGCAAGIVAIDLAKDLLDAYPSSYALVVSTEAVSYSWYTGNDTDMLLPNCFFRMGAAAILLSNFRLDRWRAKYELKQVFLNDNINYFCLICKEGINFRISISDEDLLSHFGVSHSVSTNNILPHKKVKLFLQV